MPALDDLQRCKEQLRRQAHTLRRQQPDRATLSRITQERVIALPEYRPARTVMCYVDFRSEIETRATLTTARQDGKRVVVPYCVGDCLGLFVLDTLADLAPGTMGILEPRAELRGQPERSVVAAELDLIVVPGLVFDAQCARIGYGKGYYDRLLHEVRADATLVAMAFDCQIFPEVPVSPHDVRMDRVVTPTVVYQRRQPRYGVR